MNLLRPLLVVDLFAGLLGWSQPFLDRGHRVFSVEINPRFQGISLYADVLTLTPPLVPFLPDVLLASPPCTYFTVMSIGRNWTRDHQPRNENAANAVKLVQKVVELEAYWRLKAEEDGRRFYFVNENPRAKLRKLPVLAAFERRTVTYCQYGERRMKPTDLWGVFPPSLQLKPPCNNGDPCHVSAPRGSRTGTQGMASDVSAKIPYALALDVCLAAERDVTRRAA